jgi:hypothetical protein
MFELFSSIMRTIVAQSFIQSMDVRGPPASARSAMIGARIIDVLTPLSVLSERYGVR